MLVLGSRLLVAWPTSGDGADTLRLDGVVPEDPIKSWTSSRTFTERDALTTIPFPPSPLLSFKNRKKTEKIQNPQNPKKKSTKYELRSPH